jgi:23S rRNA U2552 (ribose-2'-O)-methylase RlmE/FtsJ
MASIANRADKVKFKLRGEFRVEMATIAWAKMFESLGFCQLLPPEDRLPVSSGMLRPAVFTVHLCEAPGAFIAATNHYMKTLRRSWTWDWMGVTLNPHFEGNDQFAMIDDDKLINQTMDHWCFGADNSGDIRKQHNIQRIWSEAAARAQHLGCEKALLVTADGAVDASMDPNNQEAITASLHYCELVAAFGVLADGGNFIWKAFTLFDHSSLCCLYLMACLFERVSVYKPATSKPANSETYVVGYAFKGVTSEVLHALLHFCGNDIFSGRAIFPMEAFPSEFLDSAMMAAIPTSRSTRPGRLEPQPKLRPATKLSPGFTSLGNSGR